MAAPALRRPSSVRRRDAARRRAAAACCAALAPLVAFAAAAFAVGLVLGARHEPSERRVADALRAGVGTRRLRDDARAADGAGPRRVPAAPLPRAPTSAPPTRRRSSAVRTSRPRVRDGGDVDVPRHVRARGSSARSPDRLTLAVERGRAGRRARRSPGARTWCSRACAAASGSRARRRCRRARRSRPATARVIAQGEQRLSDLGPLASEIAGRLGPAPPERAEELAAPRRPGRRAGRAHRPRARVRRASSPARRAARCRPAGACWRAASRSAGGGGAHDDRPEGPAARRSTALAGRFGGIAVVRPRTGEVLALAGVAYSRAPAARLDVQDRHARRARSRRASSSARAKFPVADRGDARGRRARERQRRVVRRLAAGLLRALLQLGLRAARRQARRASGSSPTAERFGFNEDPALRRRGALDDPAPRGEIGDDLAVGSTAIGQGKVLATPLQMATSPRRSARTAAARRPTLLKGGGGVAGRATTRRDREVHRPRDARRGHRRHRRRRRDPRREVAGKTGTAELRTTVSEDPSPDDPTQPPPEDDPTDTDAWFAAFAPPGTRGSRSACCSSARAPAARPPRRRPKHGASRRRCGARRRGRTSPVWRAARRVARSCSSSGRFWSDSVLTLKSSSEPWIVPWPATESRLGDQALGRDRRRACRRTG